MKTEIKKPNISGIFPVLSFAVLAACIVIVLVTGARLYGRSNQQDSVDYYRRTVTGYITTRFMQSNVEGRFFVGDFHEALPRSSGNTLFFTETIGGKEYVTRVYCHEGNVYELFSPLEANIAPENHACIAYDSKSTACLLLPGAKGIVNLNGVFNDYAQPLNTFDIITFGNSQYVYAPYSEGLDWKKNYGL